MSIENTSYESIPETSETSETTEVLLDTKKEVTKLKEAVQLQETKREYFGAYLLKVWIDKNKFPRESWLGKFLRTFRYYQQIKQSALDNAIPLKYFFALKMIEGEWDPTNINTLDGGTGISQIQPDTFRWFSQTHLKKNYKMFSDMDEYKAYDYDALMKIHKNRVKVNQIIANKLVSIRDTTLIKSNDVKSEQYDINKLMLIDDRFNPNIAIPFSAKYLSYCKKYVDTKTLKHSSWDKYKKDPDFEWLLALNGYNKWPANYAKNFEGSHINNLKLRTKEYLKYSSQLDICIQNGLSYEEIINELSKEKKPSPKKEVKKTSQRPIQFKNTSKEPIVKKAPLKKTKKTKK